MIADDLFAGAGGWDLAARRLGIHARGVENMKEARATRDAAGLETIHDDVWTFRPDGKATGLIASPPCQTFSTAGKGSGRKALDDVLRGIRDDYVSSLDHLNFLGEEVGDNRTSLVLTPLHFALTGGYEWLAWEQVPGVLPVWEACAEVLRSRGWSVWTGALRAEQYGVPQTRKRAVLIASLAHQVSAPTPTHSRYYLHAPDRIDPGVLPWVSMAEAMGWGLVRQPSYTVTAGGGDGRSVWADKGVRAKLEAAAACSWRGTWAPSPRAMAPAGTSSTAVDPRPVEHPAATITGAGNAEWGMRLKRADGPSDRDPNGIRLIPAEAGILQTFPADYPWQGNQGKQFLQAGNAVPPGLAEHALMAAAGFLAEERAA